MTVEMNQTADGCEIVIKDEMTIYSAATLKQELLNKTTGCHNIDISLEHVSEMDTAGLQLMLMIFDEARKNKQQLHFSNHSAAVVDVLETMNLVAHFGDPIVMPAGGKRV